MIALPLAPQTPEQAEKFESWKKNWREMQFYWDRYEGLSADDAAALLLIAALDPQTCEAIDNPDEAVGSLGLYNDGHSIQSIASLLTYHADASREAMVRLSALLVDEEMLDKNQKSYLCAYIDHCCGYSSAILSPALARNLLSYTMAMDIEAAGAQTTRERSLFDFALSACWQVLHTGEKENAGAVVADCQDLKDKLRIAAIRYIKAVNPQVDMYGTVLHVLQKRGSDDDIMSVAGKITMLYRFDLERDWADLARIASEEQMPGSASGASLTEKWSAFITAGNKVYNGCADAPLPGFCMGEWHEDYPRLLPGNGLVPAVDIDRDYPQIAEYNEARCVARTSTPHP